MKQVVHPCHFAAAALTAVPLHAILIVTCSPPPARRAQAPAQAAQPTTDADHRATPRDARLGQVAHELHNHPQLLLAQERLDRPDDPGMSADLQPVADLERLLAAQVAGGDHLVATPQLVAISDLSH